MATVANLWLQEIWIFGIKSFDAIKKIIKGEGYILLFHISLILAIRK